MKATNKLLLLFTILMILSALPAAAMAETVKVAIMPFQINSDKDYGFLQKGIVDMLSSRLAAPDEVVIIDPQTTEAAINSVEGMSGDSLALLVGAKLQADFIIHGSITALGQNVSIDSKMLNVTGSQPPVTFFKQTQSMGEVIPQINLMATDIVSRVFRRSPPTASGPAPTAPQPTAGAPDIHTHPEKLLQSLESGTKEEKPAEKLLIKPDFWKGPNLVNRINGMVAGDVNNDGLIEIILADEKEILIVQFRGTIMQQLAVIKNPGFTYNLALDVGDINGNGTPEIYVTAMNPALEGMASFVIEYDGSQYQKIHTGLTWYFRIVDHPERGRLLLGQEQIIGSDALAAPISQLIWDGESYRKETGVLPARKANVLGLSLGDITGNNSDEAVVFDSGDELRIYKTNGNEVFNGDEKFGGSPLYMLMQPTTVDEAGSPLRFFLPVRIRIADINNDGRPEVLVPQNNDSSHRFLEKQRFYKKGSLVALNWDGLGLFPVWQSRILSGRIQDFVICDFDNDGDQDLVAAVVSKEGSLITKPQSSIISYEIGQ